MSTLTVTGLKAGSSTINISVAESTNYLAASNKTVSVTVKEPDPIPFIITSTNRHKIGYDSTVNLMSLDIPETFVDSDDGKLYKVTEIGFEAFRKCNNITVVTCPSSLVKINDRAFLAAQSLRKVIFNNGLKEIGSEVFGLSNFLEAMVIPDTVVSIGENGFFEVPHITYHGTATGSPWGALSVN